jgi:hypothetical protein
MGDGESNKYRLHIKLYGRRTGLELESSISFHLKKERETTDWLEEGPIEF